MFGCACPGSLQDGGEPCAIPRGVAGVFLQVALYTVLHIILYYIILSLIPITLLQINMEVEMGP